MECFASLQPLNPPCSVVHSVIHCVCTDYLMQRRNKPIIMTGRAAPSMGSLLLYQEMPLSLLPPCSSLHVCLPCRCGVACNLLFVLSTSQSSHSGNTTGSTLGLSTLHLDSLETSITAYFHPHSASTPPPTLSLLGALAWPLAAGTALVIRALNPMFWVALMRALCREVWLTGFSALTWLVVVNMAATGLAVSWVMKYADVIVKVGHRVPCNPFPVLDARNSYCSYSSWSHGCCRCTLLRSGYFLRPFYPSSCFT